jgi:hypothetical protein
MLRLKRTFSACFLVSILVPTIAAHAATYYVAKTGSDSHPGTEEQPWRTVASAVSKMVPGDISYVKGGTYNEGLIRFGRTGTQSAPIKLLNYPGQSPVIRCVDTTAALMVLIQNFQGSIKPIGWITIEGFEITNCYYGIKFYNLHDSVIRRNWIHDNPRGAGIQGNATRLLIDRNIVNHNGFTRPNHGIYANGTAITITNNIIYDNYHWGIQINSQCSNGVCYNPAKHAGPEFAASNNWIIANNTFAYSYSRSGIVSYGNEQNGTRIENNIFYENNTTGTAGSANGIEFYGSQPMGVVIRNNYSYASGPGGQAFIVPGSAVEGVNYTQSGNIVNGSNPGFVNAPATLPASPNFALTERSPTIDKGLHLAAITTAFDGTARPQGRAYDIGAYEYKTGGDTKPPAAPILQVH